MVVVARGQQGLGHGRAQAQNESGSLLKLHKDTSERQAETRGRIYSHGHGQGGAFLRSIKPNTRAALPGERRVEADDCNFPGLGASASEGAEMLLGPGLVVLEGGRGVGGCPGTSKKERMVRPRQGEGPRGRLPALGSRGPGAAHSQAVMMSRARSNCRCVRMRTRSATRALRLIQGHRTLAVRCPERSHSRSSVWSRTIRAAAGWGASGLGAGSRAPPAPQVRRPDATHQTGTSRWAPGRPSLCRSGT